MNKSVKGLAQSILNNTDLDDFDKYILITGFFKRMTQEQKENIILDLTLRGKCND